MSDVEITYDTRDDDVVVTRDTVAEKRRRRRERRTAPRFMDDDTEDQMIAREREIEAEEAERYAAERYAAERYAAEAERYAAEEAERYEAEAERYEAERYEAEAYSSATAAEAHADAEVHALRVIVRRETQAVETIARLELESISRLPITCKTVVVESMWKIVDGTAVARIEKDAQKTQTTQQIQKAVCALLSTLTRQVPAKKRPSRIVVVVDAHEAHLEPSYACKGLTLTTYTAGSTTALVYAPDRVVLVDECGSFFTCTLIDASKTVIPTNAQITRRDFGAGLFGTQLRVESMYLCNLKVLQFARAEKQAQKRIIDGGTSGHEIVGDFDRVFVTSDIHADLRKFVQLLVACGLITIEPYTHEDIYALQHPSLQQTQKIYDIVWHARWVASKTLLVICGDLIDGKRGSGGTGDARGSYEFLLHCLLFNLRIQARTLGSEVRFTIGNHDAGTVTAYPPYAFDQEHVEAKHLSFAPSSGDLGRRRQRMSDPRIGRRDMLLPFYACQPFLMLTLGKAIFAHAGFVHESGGSDNIYTDALARQTLLDNATLDEHTDLLAFFQPTKGELPVFWARGYAVLPHVTACYATNEAHKRFELIAVGHCVTHTFKWLDLAGQCNNDTKGTDGCVITRDCVGGPLIALVDTGMSASFRDDDRNEKRSVGMLLLDKTDRGLPEMRKVDDYHVYRIQARQFAWLLKPNGKVFDQYV
jgi:hypothetical protein